MGCAEKKIEFQHKSLSTEPTEYFAKSIDENNYSINRQLNAISCVMRFVNMVIINELSKDSKIVLNTRVFNITRLSENIFITIAFTDAVETDINFALIIKWKLYY